MWRWIGLGLFVLCLVIAAAGCSSSSGGTGTAKLYITDQPASPYSSVFVTVKRVDLVTEPGEVVTLLDTDQTVDLMTLDNVQQLLGTATIPEGEYCQVRLILSDEPGDNYVVLASDGTTTQNLLLSSQARTGLKLVGGINIEPGMVTNILLDFDASRSIVEEGNGQLRLKPVVQVVVEATPINPLGEIAGDLEPAGALPTAQIQVVDTTTSVVAAQGTVQQVEGVFQPHFEFDVPPGTYKLVITADGYQPYDSSALSPPQTWVVTADTTTPVGTITLSPAAP